MPKQRRELQKEKSAHHGRLSKQTEKNPEAPPWPDERLRYFPLIGIALIALCTLIIYGQAIPVPPIDYEDPFYLVHSPYVSHVSNMSGTRRIEGVRLRERLLATIEG